MKVALTTIDNPWNPFTNFNEWFLFDVEKGYNSSEYLGRISHTSNQLTDEENEEEIESAIDEIIRLDPFNIYKKVKKEDDENQIFTSTMGYES